MIGILLITHGAFGESLVQNVCHVLNKRPLLISQLGVSAQDDPLDILPMAKLLLREVDEGDGVLIMTDILGATPANLALKLLVPNQSLSLLAHMATSGKYLPESEKNHET